MRQISTVQEHTALPLRGFPEVVGAERVLSMMGASQLFAGLSRLQCLRIASLARSRVFARNEFLFVQGQPIRQLIMLECGRVKLTQCGSTGNEILLWICVPRETVGLHPEGGASCNHSCSAQATERCRALTWEYSHFKELLIGHPQIRDNINLIMSRRLHELEERFREIATERVAQRLAMTLTRLLKQIGRESHGGIEISLSRKELAQMTGATLFTISRILSEWTDQGFVLQKRDRVVVANAGGLRSASQGLN